MTSELTETGRAVNGAAAEQLRTAIKGRVLGPDEGDYDGARQIWNAMIDRRPALIAQVADAEDVAACVRFAREQGLPFSVRGGGHNVAGKAICEGLVIDLSRMKRIEVDESAKTCRAEPGLTWAEFDSETQKYGLATTGGTISTTGIAGLTLGGGVGWLMGAYGATCDNLLSVEMVDAEGNLLRASKDENPDLFWAVRGAGANFGVVTSFEYQLHQVGPIVAGGLVVHPFSEARSVFEFYREFTATAPDELTVYAAMLTSPEGQPSVAMAACYAGPLEDGLKALEPLKAFGKPVMEQLGPLPYSAQNTMLDAAVPPGRRNYWKSHLLPGLHDDVLGMAIEAFSKVTSPFTITIFEHHHGALSRRAEDSTAFPHRKPPYDFGIFASWEDPAEDETHTQWVRGLFSQTRPYSVGGAYVNGLADDDGSRVQEAYLGNYQRLVELKRKYDPDNVFRSNQNIDPSRG